MVPQANSAMVGLSTSNGLLARWRATKTTERVWVRPSHVVVVHRLGFCIPNDLVRVTVAFVQTRVAEFFAAGMQSVDTKTVQGVPDDVVLAGARGVGQASTPVVVMVLPAAFWMPVAGILNLVGCGIAASSIKGVVDGCTTQGKADLSHRQAAWSCSVPGIGGQLEFDALRFDRVWVAIKLVRIIAGLNWKNSGRVCRQIIRR